MPFGKYVGWSLDELPASYLRWLVSLDDLRDPLRGAILEEVERRRAESGRSREPVEVLRLPPCPSRDLAREVVTARKRVVSKWCHADLGGIHAAFLSLTAVGEWLETVIAEVAS
jgi:hypothetical protein